MNSGVQDGPSVLCSVSDRGTVGGMSALIRQPETPFTAANWQPDVVQLLDEHHLVAVSDAARRRMHFDAGQFVRQWGDEGHRQGWCLYEVGCKGPQAYYNCPTVRWNGGTSWPVQAGHPCFACAANDNWDVLGPIYSRLPNVPGAGYQATADRIGLGLTAVAGAGVVAHAILRGVQGQGSGEEKPKKEKD